MKVDWSLLTSKGRYVSLMIPGRELSTPPPDGECYLPADDEAWEKDVRRHLVHL